MNAYAKFIIDETNCSLDEAFEIEEIMREEIFHSTLDWQTPEQFRVGALAALEIFRERGFFYRTPSSKSKLK